MRKLYLFIPFVLVYLVFNFLPMEEWLGDEIPFIISKIILYTILSGLLIFFKIRMDVEIERPQMQLPLGWLLPLLIPCFTNFFAVSLLDFGPNTEANGWVLALDLVADLFTSIFEDLLFIDLVISFLFDVIPQWKKKKFLYIFTAAILFTLLHTFSYVQSGPVVATMQLVSVFLLSLECGYLAIFFDAEWIPIVAHFFFNAINFVTVHHFYEVTYTAEYFVLIALVILFSLSYTVALYKMSTLQKYKHIVEKHKKEENQNDKEA